MQAWILIVQALHVLPAVFWAGTTFALARTGGAEAERLVPAQVGALIITILAGMGLWRLTHPAGFDLTEQVLAAGAGCAVLAALIQISLALPAARSLKTASPTDAPIFRRKVANAERLASLLLAVTIICMVATRYV
jgi:hypothetical protein